MSGSTGFVRRQSIGDHGAGVSGLHAGSRAAFIMTSSSAHSRRISVPGMHSAMSRHYENSYKTEPVRGNYDNYNCFLNDPTLAIEE
jgi:hypothetical protein